MHDLPASRTSTGPAHLSDHNPRPDTRRPRLGHLLKVVVSVGILAYLVSIVPVEEIAAVLGRVDPVLVLAALALIPVAGITAAMQQKVLTDLQGMRLSVREILEVNLITRFYDLFLPGSVGAVIRWRRLSLPSKKPTEALAAIAFNRGLETLVMVGLATSFWILARPAGLDSRISAALLALFVTLLAVQAAVFNGRFSRWICRGLEAAPLNRSPRAIRDRVAKLVTAAGLYETLSSRTVGYLLLLSISRNLLGVLSLVLLARSIEIVLPFAAAGWISIFLALVAMLPISLGGLGIREASLVVFLQAYGVPAADALGLSVLLLAKKFFRALLGGVVELRHAGRASRTPVRLPPRVKPVEEP